MDLNQSKCTCLSFTRCTSPIETPYYLEHVPVKATESQKDLGILITPDLKWNLHLQSVISKASRMLGFVRRSCFEVKDPRVRKSMYDTLVRSRLAYCFQVWAPQSVKLIYSVERIQRRATKFILPLPFRSEVSYKNRLLNLNLIPLCYWHEFLERERVRFCSLITGLVSDTKNSRRFNLARFFQIINLHSAR